MPTDVLPNPTASRGSPYRAPPLFVGHGPPSAYLDKTMPVSPVVQVPSDSDGTDPNFATESPDSSDTDQDPMQVDQDYPIIVGPPDSDSDASTPSQTVHASLLPREATIFQDDGSIGDSSALSFTGDGNILNADEDLRARVTFDSTEPFNSRGQFSDLYLGTHRNLGKVALKRLRRLGTTEQDEAALELHFTKETEFWTGFQHNYILRCLGSFTLQNHRYFVSPFMKNGALFEWIKLDTPGPDRLRLIFELSDALAYIHSKGLVHGDVKAHNVLLSDDLHVQLCDFGLTKAIESCTSTRLKGTGSFRWQSPELWNNDPKTFKSDVYAFSMTIVEVLTGQIPFPDLKFDPAVMMAVTGKNTRPAREPGASLDGTSYAVAWGVAERGWLSDPSNRISMDEASKLLFV